MSRSRAARKMSGVAVVTSEALASSIGGVLRRKWSRYRSAAKELAAEIGADPRAAKNWLAGANAPRLADAIELMAADPEVEEHILALVRGRREARCSPSSSR